MDTQIAAISNLTFLEEYLAFDDPERTDNQHSNSSTKSPRRDNFSTMETIVWIGVLLSSIYFAWTIVGDLRSDEPTNWHSVGSRTLLICAGFVGAASIF